MGSDSLLDGLASAGKSTLAGAKAVSKSGYKLSKAHYDKCKGSIGDSTGDRSKESEIYETRTRFEQLPDPSNFPPPPVRRTHTHHHGGSSTKEVSDSNLSKTGDDRRYLSPSLPPTPMRSKPNSRVSSIPPSSPDGGSVNIGHAALETRRSPIQAPQIHIEQYPINASPQLQDQGEIPPPIPARNYSPSAAPSNEPDYSVHRLPPMPLPPSPKAQRHWPNLSSINTTANVPPTNVETPIAEHPPQVGMQSTQPTLGKLNTETVNLASLPPPPAHKDRGKVKQQDVESDGERSPNARLSSSERPPLGRQRSRSLSPPPVPPRSMRSVSRNSPTSPTRKSSPPSATLPPPVSKKPQLPPPKVKSENSSNRSSVTGNYNYDINVTYQPPPKPFRPPGSADPASVSQVLNRRNTLPRKSLESQSQSPPPQYTEIDHSSRFQENPLSTDTATQPYGTSIAERIASMNLDNQSTQPVQLASRVQKADNRKPPPSIPKKKDSLAGIKKVKPPIPAKKPSLGNERPSLLAPVSAPVSSPAPALPPRMPMAATSSTTLNDDNPFATYRKDVVPEHSNRLRH
ncbi:HBL138Wp [Eremothecium sinecaudum]|uniref:HBL138Wp n=1 Tax=Eremothecium sinecaudum TaxID=45286 RepID=A0A120K0W5_9SACH|nr:HBL138Wp [Eremothecium sinecaudum]AMD18764.1 HBL138Wp [Eremothecium sinecaudum]